MTNCSYGGTNRAARLHFAKYGINFVFVDFRDLDQIRANIKPETRMIFSETPANPTLTLCDIAAISRIAQQCGALHVCDATFATPLITRPIEHGADIVIQSTTKFYDGHNMTVGGAAISASAEVDAIIRSAHSWIDFFHRIFLLSGESFRVSVLY